MVIKGHFRYWKSNGRYGFVEPDDGGDQIFVHADVVDDCSIDPRALSFGTLVKCDVQIDPRGRGRRAVAIEICNA